MKPFILSIAATMLVAGSASAATYTLDFSDRASTVLEDAYGDNAQADLSTRAIDAGAYGDVVTTGDVFGWGTGYGDLTNAAWGGPNPSHAEIRIEALDPLETVTIDSFEMGGWVADEFAEWFIFDLSWTELASGTGTAPNTGGHLDVAPNTSAVGGLIFQWGADAWDVGVGNFTFSVSGPAPIPLPAGSLLLVSGLGLIALRKARKT